MSTVREIKKCTIGDIMLECYVAQNASVTHAGEIGRNWLKCIQENN